MPRPSRRDDPILTGRMLSHAAALFAQSDWGARGAPSKALGKPPDFSAGRFFAYYGSKNGILRAVFHRYWSKMLSLTQDAHAQADDSVEFVRLVLGGAIRLFRDDPHLFRAVLLNSYPHIPNAPDDESDLPQVFAQHVLEAIDRARHKGRLRVPSLSSQFVYLALVGAMEKLLNAHYVHSTRAPRPSKPPCPDYDLDEAAKRLVDAFFLSPSPTKESSVLEQTMKPEEPKCPTTHYI